MALEHLWNWFCELGGARTNNGFGLNPISFGEIAAWASLTAAMPSPWEIGVLRRLDAAVLPLLNKKGGSSGNDEPEMEVEADDEVGVKSLFAGLKSRANAVFGKKAA